MYLDSLNTGFIVYALYEYECTARTVDTDDFVRVPERLVHPRLASYFTPSISDQSRPEIRPQDGGALMQSSIENVYSGTYLSDCRPCLYGFTLHLYVSSLTEREAIAVGDFIS